MQSPELAQSSPAHPHLRKQGTATQLIVDGRPFLVIGGELHNSSASSIEYLRPIWSRLVALHFNTGPEAASAKLGTSVAISADGSVIASGSPYNVVGRNMDSISVSNRGQAVVFERGAGTWTGNASRSMLTTQIMGGLYLGISITMSADGSVVIVGAPAIEPGATLQSALLYRRIGTAWTSSTERLILNSGAPTVASRFGMGVSLSSDGKTLLVGQPATLSADTSQGSSEVLEEIIRATVSCRWSLAQRSAYRNRSLTKPEIS